MPLRSRGPLGRGAGAARAAFACLAVTLALAGAACSNGRNATVRVTGTIRPPAGMKAVCRMTYADTRGRVLAAHEVAGDFEVPVPVSRRPRTYRFVFRCEGYDDVSTALTLRALPEGEKASLGTIALGPARGSDR